MLLDTHKSPSPFALDARAHIGDTGYWVNFVDPFNPNRALKTDTRTWVHKVTGKEDYFVSGLKEHTTFKSKLKMEDQQKAAEPKDIQQRMGQGTTVQTLARKSDHEINSNSAAVKKNTKDKKDERKHKTDHHATARAKDHFVTKPEKGDHTKAENRRHAKRATENRGLALPA